MGDANDKVGEEEDVLDELPEVVEGEEDKTDYKALAIKNRGIAQRLKTKLDKHKIDSKVEKKVEKIVSEKGELDRIDKAVLRTEKMTDVDEVALVQSIMKETGKDVEGVLASKYFQTELKEMRDKKTVEDAIPSDKKRSGSSTKDSVDYWIAKGELPPANQPELRQKVVNAKIAKEKSGSQFSHNPIQ